MDLVASRSCANSDHHDNAPRFAQSARPREGPGVHQALTGRPGRESLPPPSASARRHLAAAYGSRPGSAPRIPRLPVSPAKWRSLARYGHSRLPTFGHHPRTHSRTGKYAPPPLASLFCHARHGVLAALRSSIPSFGLPPREEQPGSSLGGLVGGEACLLGSARGVRLDNRARKPGRGTHGRMIP
jgi:hypothetical protein